MEMADSENVIGDVVQNCERDNDRGNSNGSKFKSDKYRINISKSSDSSNKYLFSSFMSTSELVQGISSFFSAR